MSRKKKPDESADAGVLANGTAGAEVPEPQPPPVSAPTGPNRPAASFTAHSDLTTRIEVAVWGKPVKVGDEEITQYTLTLSRSWRTREGNWQGNAAFRIHDVPVLLYLLEQAYNWCVAQRTSVTIGGEPLPF